MGGGVPISGSEVDILPTRSGPRKIILSAPQRWGRCIESAHVVAQLRPFLVPNLQIQESWLALGEVNERSRTKGPELQHPQLQQNAVFIDDQNANTSAAESSETTGGA